ncbi:MAG TPA: hypothetical protein VL576_02920 [Candidatus Paceibacterota bacterium]|nr:hypothetical protein [Candidatus Paceibacterota bacterium]
MEEVGIDPFDKKYLYDPEFEVKNVLYETDFWIVFTNQHKYQKTKHQFVFVSQEYVETLWELPAEAHADLIGLFKKITQEYNIKGGGITTRFGDPEKSGATVKHLHLQLIEPEDGQAVPAWFGSEK